MAFFLWCDNIQTAFFLYGAGGWESCVWCHRLKYKETSKDLGLGMLGEGSEACKIRQSPDKYLNKWDDISGISLSTDVK